MKTLLLVRHAKSSWDDPSLADRERALNRRGRRSARRMGRYLARGGLMSGGLASRRSRPDLILSSPAARALKTARLLARRLNCRRRDIAVQEALYEASATHLLKTLRALDQHHGRVMLVGHNPEITALAHAFSASIVHMPTCAVACFTFDTTTWAHIGRASLKHMGFSYPKKIED